MSSRQRVSVIIPTLESDPVTLESVPNGIETAVVSEGNRAKARNIGVERTDGEVLVFCDDDIRFPESFFWEWVDRSVNGTIIGLLGVISNNSVASITDLITWRTRSFVSMHFQRGSNW